MGLNFNATVDQLIMTPVAVERAQSIDQQGMIVGDDHDNNHACVHAC